MITTVMYSIRTSRNNLTHGEVGFNPTKTMDHVRETLQVLQLPKEKSRKAIIHPACKWQKPNEGFVKVNSDGALRIEDEVRPLALWQGMMCLVEERLPRSIRGSRIH